MSDVLIEMDDFPREVYHSFEECPLDEPPGWEGDDSLHGVDLGAGIAAWLAPPRPTLAEPLPIWKLVVPHPRDLKRGMSGWDVLALHRALAKAGFHSWSLRKMLFGVTLDKDLRRYQAAKGIKADGVYGSVTHAKLAPHYDSYGISLILRVKVETPIEKRRRLWLAAAMTLYNMAGRVHYTQGAARMSIVKRGIKTTEALSRQTAIWEDCSSSVTGLFFMANAPDPNGFGYNGLGYTGTLSLRGRKVTSGETTIGALGFYGSRYPWDHVVGVVAKPAGDAIRVFSHGSESGPYLLEVGYRGDFGHWRNFPGISY